MKLAKAHYRYYLTPHYAHGFRRGWGDDCVAEEAMSEYPGARARRARRLVNDRIFEGDYRYERCYGARRLRSWKARCRKRHQWERHRIGGIEGYWTELTFPKIRRTVWKSISEGGGVGVINVDCRDDVKCCLDDMLWDKEIEIPEVAGINGLRYLHLGGKVHVTKGKAGAK